MLEPLGVALPAWDLGRTRTASTVAVVGAGSGQAFERASAREGLKVVIRPDD